MFRWFGASYVEDNHSATALGLAVIICHSTRIGTIKIEIINDVFDDPGEAEIELDARVGVLPEVDEVEGVEPHASGSAAATPNAAVPSRCSASAR